MIPPPKPANEDDRLQALRELEILDTPPEERFDRLTRLARDMFDAPIALVSIVDGTRQWFKSAQGLEATETSREVSFCGHAIMSDEVMVVPDATADARFADNPLVLADPSIRFYAGAPLSAENGQHVGTLCVIDTKPREWTAEQSRTLRELADVVQEELQQNRIRDQRLALQALSEAAQDTDDDVREILRRALVRGCDYLGLELGAISKVDGDRVEVLVSRAEDGLIREGAFYDLNDTYARLSFVADDVVIVNPADDLLTQEAAPIERSTPVAYIGMPLSVKGSLFGVLSFATTNVSFTQGFNEAQKDFVRLLSKWVAAGIHRWDLDRRIVSQQQLAGIITRAQASFITKHDRRETFEGLLEDILIMMDCDYGFIGEVLHDETGVPYLKTLALTNIAWNDEMQALYEEYQDEGLEFRNLDTLFGRTLTEETVVIANHPYEDPRRGGLPPGHPALNAYLGVPLFSNGLIGMLALGNKKGGFTDADVDALETVLITAAQFIDIYRTARQRREDQQVIERLSMVASQMLSGIIITDIDGYIEWANDAFTHITEYPLEQLIGLRPRDALHGKDTDEATVKSVFDSMSRREAFEVDLLAYKRSGTSVWVRITANPLADEWGDPEGYMVMVADISELKSIERMKSGFVSTVSHELRTPLTAITGALALVSSGVTGDVPDGSRKMIEIAYKNSERLGRLIDDLLDMDKLVEGKVRLDMQVTRLMPIVERSIVANQAYAEQFGVDLRCRGEMAGIMVDVDVDRIDQVLSNLISNAAKFSSAHAVVDVNVVEAKNAGWVRVEVVDRGRGIPASAHHLLFEKFSQVDSTDTRVTGGTGLGLAISKELIQRMGGLIGFSSEENVGSTFFFELPIAMDEAALEKSTAGDRGNGDVSV